MEQTIHETQDSDAAMFRQAFADALKQQKHITTSSVEEAFHTVPRHLFLPNVPLETAYSNVPVYTRPRGREERVESCSSLPSLMASMLEVLDLQPGMRVLEIGAGTGYNAALMAQIVGPTGQIYTIDIDEDIVADARWHLKSAGYERVQVLLGDGGWGYQNAAPYDRIVVTVGAPTIAPAWYTQLASDGRLAIPLEITPFHSKITLHLLMVLENIQGILINLFLSVTQFVFLRGDFAAVSGASVALGPHPAPMLTTLVKADAEYLYKSLLVSSHDELALIQISLREIGGFYLWLALQDALFCELYAEGNTVRHELVPFLIGDARLLTATFGLCDEQTLCVLQLSEETFSLPEGLSDLEKPLKVLIRTFGLNKALAHRLRDSLCAWESAGRPFTWTLKGNIENVRIKAYPSYTQEDATPQQNKIILKKNSMQILFEW